MANDVTPTRPNDDVYNDGETVSTIISKYLLPQLPFVPVIPFTKTTEKYIVANTEAYSSDTDPLNETPSEGAESSGLAGWPEVNVTLGEATSLNTKMRKTKCSFTKDDLRDPRFNSIVQKTYGRMAWLIAKQINSNISTTLKVATTGNNAAHTHFDAKHVDAWSGNPDPLLDIRAIAEDISINVGYELDTIIVYKDDYYYLMDYLEASDVDRDYARAQFPPNQGFYKTMTYLKNPGCWVVGAPSGVGVSDGDIIGIGKFMGGPCIENFCYADPEFTFAPLPVGADEGPNAALANLPVNINPWSSPDNRTFNVEAWINSVCHVGNPNGIFYKGSAI